VREGSSTAGIFSRGGGRGRGDVQNTRSTPSKKLLRIAKKRDRTSLGKDKTNSGERVHAQKGEEIKR